MVQIDTLLTISLDDFFKKYLKENVPCIFDEDFTKSWLCRSDWNDINGINLTKLLQYHKLGDEVTVADCNNVFFDSHKKLDMKFSDFMSYWGDHNLGEDERVLYLKDWHYFLNNEKARTSFDMLEYFESDWLNEFWSIRNDISDDFRFVYVGVEGSWTGIHTDVCQSYSWSVNISGEKRWLLFPPGSEKGLMTTSGDIRDDANLSCVPHIDVIQRQGEIMFVPSGWHHQVINISPCVSINHNWINGCSVMRSWEHLCSKLSEVEEATSDVRLTPGYAEECQVCLKAYCGMDYQEFITMIEYILYKRLQKMKGMPHNNCDQKLVGYTDTTLAMQYRLEELLTSAMSDSAIWQHALSPPLLNVVEVNDLVCSLEVLDAISTDKVCTQLTLINEDMRVLISENVQCSRSWADNKH